MYPKFLCFETAMLPNTVLMPIFLYLHDGRKGRLQSGLKYIQDIKSNEQHVFMQIIEQIEKYFVEG